MATLADNKSIKFNAVPAWTAAKRLISARVARRMANDARAPGMTNKAIDELRVNVITKTAMLLRLARSKQRMCRRTTLSTMDVEAACKIMGIRPVYPLVNGKGTKRALELERSQVKLKSKSKKEETHSYGPSREGSSDDDGEEKEKEKEKDEEDDEEEEDEEEGGKKQKEKEEMKNERESSSNEAKDMELDGGDNHVNKASISPASQPTSQLDEPRRVNAASAKPSPHPRTPATKSIPTTRATAAARAAAGTDDEIED